MADFRSKDYYKILQVDPQAKPDGIRSAFKQLALKYHPDQNHSSEATRIFLEIKEAYEILGTPYKRDQYDRERAAAINLGKKEKMGSVAQKSNMPKSAKKGRYLLSFLLILIMALIITGSFILANMYFRFIELPTINLQFLSTPTMIPIQPSIENVPSPAPSRNYLLPSLGVTYIQVYNAYIKMGNFEFNEAPLALPNQQVRLKGNLSGTKFKSSVVIVVEGIPKDNKIGLCKAAVTVNIREQTENQAILRYLKQMPMIIVPSWAGNDWMAEGLMAAEKSMDKKSTRQINYLGILVGWDVDLRNNTLGLTFDSGCSSK